MPGRPLTLAAAVCLAAFAAFAQEPGPERLADILAGDAAGEAAANPQCLLFTPDEIAGFLGAPVEAGVNAGMGMGCQWLARGDAGGDAMVTVVPADYAERPSLAPGFAEVPSLGPDGFVVPELGGWAAGVASGAEFVKASLAGPGASPERTVEFLRDALARRGG